MNGNFKISVNGHKNAQAAFSALYSDVKGKDLLRAVRDAAKPMVDDIRRNARAAADSGALANSIDTKSVSYDYDTVVVVVIGPNADYVQEVTRRKTMPNGKTFMHKMKARPANYAHLIEFGSAPHKLGSKPNAALHPGSKEQPFMRPGFDRTRKKVVDRLGQRLGRTIMKSAQKHNKGEQ